MLHNYLRGREVVAVRSKASVKRAAAAMHLAMGWQRVSTAGKKQRHRGWYGACSAADHAKLVIRQPMQDLNTAAVKCQHTVILLMKMTIFFSVESWLTKDMFYSRFCPTVIPSLTV